MKCSAQLDIYGVNDFTSMPPDPKKIQALRASGTLNPRPQKVRNPRFAETEFFDPHDLVQVKYETLRAVEVDGQAGAVRCLGCRA